VEIAVLERQPLCDEKQSYVWHEVRDSRVEVSSWLTCGNCGPRTSTPVRREAVICVTWLIHMCNMTHLYVWRDSFTCVTWLVRVSMTHSHVGHDSFICHVTQLYQGHESFLCHVTHPTGHDSFVCATCLIHTWDMTHSHVWHDSFTCVTWLIHMCDMSKETYIRDKKRPLHESYICVIHMFICEYVTRAIMVFLRFVGSIGSIQKRPTYVTK